MDGTSLHGLLGYIWLVPIVFLLMFYRFALRIFGVVIIPKGRIGQVNKKFVIFGKNRNLPGGAIIALTGEAGYQADTLSPGVHYWLWPWQYEISMEDFTIVNRGFIGVVQAKDGKAITGGRVLGKHVDCDSFQNARAFLQNGGERGDQLSVILPGTYRINKFIFSVVDEPVQEIEDNMVGVVTTQDGTPLPTGEIAGHEVHNHNMFQNGQAFMENGGYKGLQEQVILAGRYFLNPHFVTVEIKPMKEVPIAHVGVVVAYVGEAGADVTGDAFQHGNLVSKGEKGVWVEPYDPGKYAINPFTHSVENVPTANIVLNWATGKTESHKLDEKLSTITVRSADGFKFNLDVSQIIHIPRADAPKVIARFGTVANLVTQVLEPTIGNYFRNAAQGSDAIGFLRERQQRQEDATRRIAEALKAYNVVAVDTLIGDINPPDELMKPLTDRKVAEQEKITYETQRLAEETRKELEQARAQAATQARVVDAERSVQIAEFTAQAAVKTATGAAESKKINAQADAQVTIVNGDAEAGKIAAIGQAEAAVIRLKIDSIQSDNYARIEVARALATSGFKLVPDVVAGGNGEGGRGTLIDVLVAGMIRDKITNNGHIDATPAAPNHGSDTGGTK